MAELEALRKSRAEFQAPLDDVEGLLKDDAHNAEFLALRDEVIAQIAALDEQIAALEGGGAASTSESAPASASDGKIPDPQATSRPDFKRPGAPSNSAAPPASPVTFQVNEVVMAKYHKDKSFYKARITSITGSSADPVYTVLFPDYGNSEQVRTKDLKALSVEAKKRNNAEAFTPKPGVISANPSINPSLAAEARKEASKVSDGPERPAKAARKVGSKSALESHKSNWQNFTKTGKGGKSVKPQSMFRSKDSAEQGVGPQTKRKEPARVRHKFRKAEDAEDA